MFIEGYVCMHSKNVFIFAQAETRVVRRFGAKIKGTNNFQNSLQAKKQYIFAVKDLIITENNQCFINKLPFAYD